MKAGPWAVFALYSLAVIGLGVFAWRRKRARRLEHKGLEFWMANRELPGWRLAVSLTSGWLMLGWIGFGMSQIYAYGATALWILPIPWLVLCFLVIFLVPFYRRIGAVSLPQGIQRRFGTGARLIVAIFSVGVFVSWTGAELFMAGALLDGFLGIDSSWVIVLFVIPILVYTILGSFRAIVTTDLVQFAIMVFFMIALGGTAVSRALDATGGDLIGGIRASAPPWSGEGMALDFGVLGWLFPIVLLVGYLPGWAVEQDLWLRIHSAPTTREAQKGAVLGLFSIGIFVIAIPTLVAFCALVVFPPGTEAAAAVGENFYGIIPAFIEGMGPALSLVMVLGLVACQMSTVDTFANVAAMPLAYDLFEPLVLARRKRGRETTTRWAQGLSGVAILLGLGYALVAENLSDVYYLSSGVLSACIAVPALAMFWRRANAAGVIAAVVAGLLGTVGMYLYEYHHLQYADPALPNYYTEGLPGFLHGSYQYNYVGAGVVLSALVLVVTTLLTSPAPDRHAQAVSEVPLEGESSLSLVSEGNYAGREAGDTKSGVTS